jgi:hypothetical protein
MNDEMVYLGMSKDEALFLAHVINDEVKMSLEEGNLGHAFQCDILLKCITVSLGKPIKSTNQ